MWEQVTVSVGGVTHRGRYRLEGQQLVLEWRGGRASTACGWARPEVAAAAKLQKLVLQGPVAA